MKWVWVLTMIVASLHPVPNTAASPVLILVEPETTEALPDSTVAVEFLIRDLETTPLFGYSLDVDLLPGLGASGQVLANIGLTNFFDTRNLITAGGATRDPMFSDILGPGDGGVFITTNTDDGSTVLAIDGVNDVLAQVFFDVSADAFGDFTLRLGPASALSDIGGDVSFGFSPATITAVPEPGTIAYGILALGLLARRNRRRKGAN